MAIPENILLRSFSLSGINRKEGESDEDALMRALDQIEKQKLEKETQCETDYGRVGAMLQVVMSMAKLDYSCKAVIGDDLDHLDGLAAGINMLGEELEKSTVTLQEKEVLLKEIHHRVKNNLQVISSLLNIQAGQIDDPVLREKYRVSCDRIRSMALVHEKLYESGNLTLIDFSDYIGSLVQTLNAGYNPDTARIRLQTRLEPDGKERFLRIETAIPCGLILNELLTNSFKYAFPGERNGLITVEFDSRKEGNFVHYRMLVSDNGIGLPQELIPAEAESLGMQLIHLLSDQLEGKICRQDVPGTAFVLDFSLPALN